ncbi:MAG: hypothetical protein OXN84_03480 [Albidovulum sp.]|nr:hypothetical protein [Albidovulum sp.]
MRPVLAEIICLAIGRGGISANAGVRAQCSPIKGYSNFIENKLANNEARTVEADSVKRIL